jgi:hypothetical protein
LGSNIGMENGNPQWINKIQSEIKKEVNLEGLEDE